MKLKLNRINLTIFLLLFAAVALAQDPAAARKGAFNTTDGLGIEGYDPVAYFVQGKAVKGSRDLAVFHQGITYMFSSVANKELFKKDPAHYEPAYGGWCAYAMGAKGEKVEVDPKTFKITNGRLFLFYNKFFNNTLTDWNKDEQKLQQKADQNWMKFFKG